MDCSSSIVNSTSMPVSSVNWGASAAIDSACGGAMDGTLTDDAPISSPTARRKPCADVSRSAGGSSLGPPPALHPFTASDAAAIMLIAMTTWVRLVLFMGTPPVCSCQHERLLDV